VSEDDSGALSAAVAVEVAAAAAAVAAATAVVPFSRHGDFRRCEREDA
jgi:hypothetical protein